MNFFGIGQSADIDIVFDGADARKLAEVKTEDGKKEKYLLYYDGETVSGRVNVTLKKPGSKLEHQGIRIDLIGQIELYYDRGNHHEFQSLVKELARPGDLIQNTNYPFEFANVEKPYEVYVGSNVRLRYFLRVTITRRITDIVREIDVAVHTLCSYPEMNSPIKMEVGIEDCLHIEFEYNKSKYHLKDVIVGKIYFLLVRIKIKHMEIAIIKRETTGSGPNTFTENETIAKYEIMDGAPVKGESIPIRVFLAGYDLTPTMRDINKKFSVRYFLNLVLMDTEDRRYFKQQEITLWRKADKGRKSALNSSSNPHVPSHLVGSDGEIMSSADLLAARGAQSQAMGAGSYQPAARSGGLMRQPLGGGGDDDDDEEYDDEEATIDGGRRRVGFGGGVVMDEERSSVGAAATAAASESVSTTMGLFKQENSPIQESRPLPTNASSSSLAEDAGAAGGHHATAASSSSTVSSPSADSSLFADVESLRGAGDGAPYTGAASEGVTLIVTAEVASSPPESRTPVAEPVAVADGLNGVAGDAQPPPSETISTGAAAAAAAKPTIAAKPTAAVHTPPAEVDPPTSTSPAPHAPVTVTTSPPATDDDAADDPAA